MFYHLLMVPECVMCLFEGFRRKSNGGKPQAIVKAALSGFKILQSLPLPPKTLLVNIYIACPGGGRIGKCG